MKKLFTALMLFQTAVFAQNNYSLLFHGVDDYLTIPEDSSYTGMSELSVMIWVKFKSLPDWQHSQGGYALIEKIEHVSANANGSYGLYTEYDYDALRFDVRLDDDSTINLRWEPFSSYIDTIQWHQIVGVYDGHHSYIYFDGVRVATSFLTSLGTIKITNYPIGLSTGWGNYDYWKGLANDMSIWNIALDSAKISQYKSCPPTGIESGLVGYWDFEEGSGTVATDETANHNNGTLINGVDWVTDVPSTNCISGIRLNNLNTIEIYPNPTRDEVVLHVRNYNVMPNYSIKITNSVGQKIFNSQINQEVFTISLSQFGSAGIFYVQVINQKGQIVDARRIILQ